MNITYTATCDEFSECPLEWGWDGETVLFNAGYHSVLPDISDANSEPLQAVHRVVLESNAAFDAYPKDSDRLEFALRVVNRLYPDTPVKTLNVRGYSQGDYWQFLYVGDQPLDALKSWLLGNVWTVTRHVQETCDMGHVHDVDTESLGGIYADSEEEAIAYAKEEME